MRRLSFLLATVALLAAACGPATTPSENPTSSPTATTTVTGCAAQLAAGTTHYKVVRADLDGAIIELADKGVGLSFGYEALSSDSSEESFAEGLALYAPAGVVLMTGGLRPDSPNDGDLGWFMGSHIGRDFTGAKPVPTELADCPMFELPLNANGTEVDQEKLAALGDTGRILTSFVLVQTGDPYIRTDELTQTTALVWGEVTLILEQQPSADYRD